MLWHCTASHSDVFAQRLPVRAGVAKQLSSTGRVLMCRVQAKHYAAYARGGKDGAPADLVSAALLSLYCCGCLIHRDVAGPCICVDFTPRMMQCHAPAPRTH
jgi:hypothetical protein